jgi:hypothetical protein
MFRFLLSWLFRVIHFYRDVSVSHLLILMWEQVPFQEEDFDILLKRWGVEHLD